MFEKYRTRKHSAEGTGAPGASAGAAAGLHLWPGCGHTPGLPAVEPASSRESCLHCDEDGDHPVQLRKCLVCGNVACCDSSPGRHARAHAERTGHPVMRSYEPGESWRWCYSDERLV